ncbi:uncharacterized protein LAJ45_09520 [Morchella importuna]|uniref:uncharacterized protein n=1 Tax=Morchella importuna TaxID=1174673 RepID=UPI001E8CCF52|nr:uncharacterized protein LAJ45_09520 [Morchella importuna]KAH8146327.1 hypothetical protein LAJ45_09520 [Morchella importuna]
MDWEFATLSSPYFGELANTILRLKDSGASIWDKETLEAAVTIADTARRVGENKKSRTLFINLNNWRAAESHLRTLVEIQERFSHIEGCSYVTQLSNWARVLVKLNKHDEAKATLIKIAELGKRVDDPTEVLIHRLKLAETQRFCGDLKEAEGLLLQVLKDSREGLRADHLKTIRVLELLCYVYYDQKNWAQAELKGFELVKLSQ